MHNVVWPNDKIIDTIVQCYVTYVAKLGESKIVIFDGYSTNVNASTKAYEMSRRQNKNHCCEINIDCNTKLTLAQEKFLSNSRNKEQLISLICAALTQSNIETIIANEDADRVIENLDSNVIVMGKDIDLLRKQLRNKFAFVSISNYRNGSVSTKKLKTGDGLSARIWRNPFTRKIPLYLMISCSKLHTNA